MPRFTFRRVKRGRKLFSRRGWTFRGRGAIRARRAFLGPTRPIAAPGAASRIIYRKMRFWDTAIETGISGGLEIGVGKNMALQLNAFATSANMVSAYDEYAIVNWRVTLYPAQSMSVALPKTGGVLLGNLAVYGLAIDLNGGASTPSSIADILAYDGAKTTTVNRRLSTGWFTPKPSTLMYNGMTPAFGVPEGADGLNWLRSVDDTAGHYGVLIYVEPSSFTTTQVSSSAFNVLQEVMVAFRVAH